MYLILRPANFVCGLRKYMLEIVFFVKEVFSDSNKIILWQESEDINKKVISKISGDSNFALSSYFMIMCVSLLP